MAILKVVPAATVALLALTGCSTSEPTETVTGQTGPTKDLTGPPAGEPVAIGEPANVTRVIDGDTIEVALDNEIVTVRLIGIDTPETVHPTEPVGCFGPAASRFTTSALEGRPVRLEFDVERLDQYGRTLAYVWLGDELFNETLVREGYAVVDTFPPNVKYVEKFTAGQQDAQSHERGLWGAVCHEPEPEPVDTGGGGGGKCDPSYPDVCIPPYPPDLDCADIPFTYFEVKPADPHDFDSDADADLIGCES
jgi:micrococcal nuclease